MSNTRHEDIHFLRECLVADPRGNLVAVMQYSSANTEYLHPKFVEAPFYAQAELTTLYNELGGGRGENAPEGNTLVLPHRSGWQKLRRLTAGEVEIRDPFGSDEESAAARAERYTQARRRNHLMRD